MLIAWKRSPFVRSCEIIPNLIQLLYGKTKEITKGRINVRHGFLSYIVFVVVACCRCVATIADALRVVGLSGS